VQKLSAGAQPLQHVAWLIHAPARAVILSREGINVNVPQPARYAIHKLILAQKRQEVYRLKRMKDLAQAKSLISALRMSDPNGLQDAYENACAQGEKGWAAPIRRSLKEIGEKL
jgi:hypothetical protein